MSSEEGHAMTDANEPLDEKVKRLEAEAEVLRKQLTAERAAREQATADRDRYKQQYEWVSHDLSRKEWEGITQEDLDAAMQNTGVLERVIAELERGDRGV
jgi:hypothetical protein